MKFKRFQAVPREITDIGRVDSTTWWVVWDWRDKKVVSSSSLFRHDARKAARKFNKHDWLMK